MNNEAVFLASFKHKEGDLKVVAVPVESEEVAKVAKETVHGMVMNPISGLRHQRGSHFRQGSVSFSNVLRANFCQKLGHLKVCV